MKLRTLEAGAEPNLSTVRYIGLKMFGMNSFSGGVNRRKLFELIKKSGDWQQSYSWMVEQKLVNEFLAGNPDFTNVKRPLMVELTERGREYIDRIPDRKAVSQSFVLPPVAYAVDRELFAKVAVKALMLRRTPAEELTRILSEYATDLNSVLYDIAKKNKPELFH